MQIEIRQMWDSNRDARFWAHVLTDVSGMVLAVDEASMLNTMGHDHPVTIELVGEDKERGIVQWLSVSPRTEPEGVWEALDRGDAAFEIASFEDAGIWWYAPEWVFESTGN